MKATPLNYLELSENPALDEIFEELAAEYQALWVDCQVKRVRSRLWDRQEAATIIRRQIAEKIKDGSK